MEAERAMLAKVRQEAGLPGEARAHNTGRLRGMTKGG